MPLPKISNFETIHNQPKAGQFQTIPQSTRPEQFQKSLNQPGLPGCNWNSWTAAMVEIVAL
jgi:hypothetical protein